MPREAILARGGRWSAERDAKTGEWRAVKPLPVKKGEYGPVRSVRLIHDLGLPPGSSHLDAEREILRLLQTGRIAND